jgi:hypothetical protein
MHSVNQCVFEDVRILLWEHYVRCKLNLAYCVQGWLWLEQRGWSCFSLHSKTVFDSEWYLYPRTNRKSAFWTKVGRTVLCSSFHLCHHGQPIQLLVSLSFLKHCFAVSKQDRRLIVGHDVIMLLSLEPYVGLGMVVRIQLCEEVVGGY